MAKIEHNEFQSSHLIRPLVWTLIGNLILSALKLIAGILGYSKALISDAVHSLSDVASTVIVIIGIKIANKDADDDHHYGHEKFEAIASMILAMILIFTAGTILYQGTLTLIGFFRGTIEIKTPTLLALSVALLSIITKEAMFWYTRYHGMKLRSTAMIADAWHHRSDAFSSVGSLLGIGLAMLGYLYFDMIAAILVSAIIFKVALDIMIKAVNQVVDKTPDPHMIADITTYIQQQKGVLAIDVLNVRMHVEKLYVDVEIAVDENLSLVDAHKIAEQVHIGLEQAFEDIKHCMVHVNPMRKDKPRARTHF